MNFFETFFHGGSTMKPRSKSKHGLFKSAPPLAAIFPGLCLAHGLAEPVDEFQFAPPRKYRFDWCWPERHIALEIEGGLFGVGPPCKVCGRRGPAGHISTTGLLRDVGKYNLAAIHGWRIIRCTPSEVKDGSVFATLSQAMPPQLWEARGPCYGPVRGGGPQEDNSDYA